MVGVVENSPNQQYRRKTGTLYLPSVLAKPNRGDHADRPDKGQRTFTRILLRASYPATLDRRLDPMSVATEEQFISYSAAQDQMTAELVTALGFIGLLLTAVGLYGVVSYSVKARTREIGIRIALGSGRSETIRLILREPIVMGALGMTIGLQSLHALYATRGGIAVRGCSLGPCDLRSRSCCSEL